jgi:hypothetical protein
VAQPGVRNSRIQDFAEDELANLAVSTNWLGPCVPFWTGTIAIESLRSRCGKSCSSGQFEQKGVDMEDPEITSSERFAGPPSSIANNSDLVVWALHQLGGSENWVDVEQIYLKSFEIAPARFAWRTRPDLPSYKKCAKGLIDVERVGSVHRAHVTKRGHYERKLTMTGVAWCESHKAKLGDLYGSGVVQSTKVHSDSRRLREVSESNAFNRWTEHGEFDARTWELAEVLRCLPDSPPSTWASRLDEIEVAAKRNGRGEIEEFVALARSLIAKEQADG